MQNASFITDQPLARSASAAACSPKNNNVFDFAKDTRMRLSLEAGVLYVTIEDDFLSPGDPPVCVMTDPTSVAEFALRLMDYAKLMRPVVVNS